MRMTLNFKSDTTNIVGTDILLHCTNSVHYSIPLTGLCIDIKFVT